MLIAHLSVGLVSGLFAAFLSLAQGGSPLAALGVLVLGGQAGLLASAGLVALSGVVRARPGEGRRVPLALGSALMFVLGVLALGWKLAR